MDEQYLNEKQAPKPACNLGIAIAGTILSGSSCIGLIGLPFGISGIVNAAKVNNLYNSGQYEAACEAAASAKKKGSTALTIGIIGAALFWTFYIIYYVVLLSNM